METSTNIPIIQWVWGWTRTRWV